MTETTRPILRWHGEREALADGASKRTEVLWLNPACTERLDAELMPLFGESAA